MNKHVFLAVTAVALVSMAAIQGTRQFSSEPAALDVSTESMVLGNSISPLELMRNAHDLPVERVANAV
jgi:hypothetical protein